MLATCSTKAYIGLHSKTYLHIKTAYSCNVRSIERPIVSIGTHVRQRERHMHSLSQYTPPGRTDSHLLHAHTHQPSALCSSPNICMGTTIDLERFSEIKIEKQNFTFTRVVLKES